MLRAGGARLAAERGGAERRQESEAVPNREGAARGHALAVFNLLAQSALAALGLRSEKKLAPRRATFNSQN